MKELIEITAHSSRGSKDGEESWTAQQTDILKGWVLVILDHFIGLPDAPCTTLSTSQGVFTHYRFFA